MRERILKTAFVVAVDFLCMGLILFLLFTTGFSIVTEAGVVGGRVILAIMAGVSIWFILLHGRDWIFYIWREEK